MVRTLLPLFIIVVVFAGCRKSDFYLQGNQEVLRDDGSGTGTVTWTKENEYILEGFVFVNDGQELTIEAGTVVRFRAGQAENASALIVSRGGKIIANGTRDEPIVFTAEGDDLEGSVTKDARGLWGGLIILGNAPINLAEGEASIEGIPLAEPRGIYGGVDEFDNSGVLRYVSIRHGGTNIGEGNEINGLTLGGVGQNTKIEYVEVIANNDDGIEIFGGTVNLENIVISGCDDDAFDYDLGWTGNGQFWLGVQSEYLGDNLIEAGGGVEPITGLPQSLPKIYNATLIGNGETGNGACAVFERNSGGVIANSIFLNKAKGVVLQVSDLEHDSYGQWKTGDLAIKNNLFYNVASEDAVFQLSGFFTESNKNEWENYFNVAQNSIDDPGIDWQNGNYVPPEEIENDLHTYPDSWFQIVDFKGAFGEDNWIEGWTLLAE